MREECRQMKILHYVDENNLAWGETWIQLIKELTAQGTDCSIMGTGSASQALRSAAAMMDLGLLS